MVTRGDTVRKEPGGGTNSKVCTSLEVLVTCEGAKREMEAREMRDKGAGRARDLSVSEWSCVTAAGGCTLLGSPAGRVDTAANPVNSLARG